VTIQYAEHAPGPGLADAVRAYWSIRGDAAANAAPVNRVLPDNCIDVVFDLRSQPSAFVVGPMLTAEVIPHAADIDLLGVRFSPGAATEFLDARAAELAAANVDAGDLWPDTASLVGQLIDTPHDARPLVLDAYLLRRRRARRDATLARRAAAAIQRSGGRLTVDELASAVSVSDRTVLRAFLAAVGIGPKDALRVQRFRVAARLLERSVGESAAPMSLAGIAAACGYADQSHFTRDFNALAGLTPGAYRTEKRIVGIVQD